MTHVLTDIHADIDADIDADMDADIGAANHSVNYLRLSITDRCNLRCMYCMPEEGVAFQPHGEILSYEEVLRFVRVAVESGIRKVRLTGGEPLVRKGFIGFLERLCKIKDLHEITLTTNGVLLKPYAPKLMECGICRINVSLDTLRPDRFARITGRDFFGKVWEGIEEAERLGFDPIKINVVAIRGLNDDEILDFVRLTKRKPYHIRFIELMPVGEFNAWSPDKFISIEEIRRQIHELSPLRPVRSDPFDGPAERYVLEGGKGEIGFIGAMSNHFCDHCNRLRLTADGHLRTCLFSDREIDIKGPLRNGAGEADLLNLVKRAVESKPRKSAKTEPGFRKCVRHMSSIGG